MDINISEANQFINLHAHPEAIKIEDLSLINDWISRYPYCQSLHFLAAQASKQLPGAEDYLAKAATFASNREVLFQFINHTENFESENVVLDEFLNTPSELTEIIEPRNDMGQAFGADLNYYKIDEDETAVEEENIDTTENVGEENNEEFIAEEEVNNDAEQLEKVEAVEENFEEEVTEEPIIEEENFQTDEPLEETQNIEETIEEEETAGDVAEEQIQIDEPVEETQSIEEVVAENEEEVVAEEQAQTDEPIEESQNIEDTVAEENIEEIVAEEQAQTDEPLEETPNIEETVAENKEEIVAEEQAQTDEPIEEIQNIEEAIAEENTEKPVEEEQAQIDEPIEEAQSTEEAVAEVVEEPVDEEEKLHTEDPIQENNGVKSAEKDELIFDSPIATDFFAFAKTEKPESLPTPEQSKKEEEQPTKKESVKEDIAQYNDERLPYTFLWWLNKTRKEHASNTQPYVKAVKPKPVAPKKENAVDTSLSHQIAENIFHLRGAEEIGSNPQQNQTVPFDFRKKEFQIIEKFIKEEPQIKPPAANKIDTENKAKKSSEDTSEVVSETLAKIYVEQMLYHKALDVYKKLSLKYPEKSTYFASQIKYLELKVN